MRITTPLTIACAVLLGLCGTPAQAQEAAGATGEIALSAQGTTVDGDEAHFRENSLGERGGLNLDWLRLERRDGDSLLRLDARFTAGGSGWFDMDWIGDRWRGTLRATRVSRWSDTSFAGDVLPSGTPVGALYPGDTALDPLFGEEYPNQDFLRVEGILTRRISGADRISLRVGAMERSGVRVPNFGGFSFSDVGTASFYTAGLEDADVSSSWATLDGQFHAGPVAIRLQGGLVSRSDGRQVTMPAYGHSMLLDLNQWDGKSSVDTAWGRASAAWTAGAHSLRGAFSWASSSVDPRGGDRRVDTAGELVAPGLEIAGGSLDRTAVSGAVAWTWKSCSHARLTLAADAQHRYGNGAVDLERRLNPWAVAASRQDESRVGGLARVDATFGSATLRFTARASSAERSVHEERASFSEDVVRSRDRTDLRLDGRVVLAEGLSLRAWARYRDDETEVDLIDLWDGYAAGTWERKETSGLVSLRYASGRWTASLSGAAWSQDFDLSVPMYDPIFDPSLDLVPVTADQTGSRYTAGLSYAGERGSAWIEGGWLEAEYDLPAGSFAGYAPIDETVSGSVIAAGGELSPWEGGSLNARVEWVGEGDDRDADLVRGGLRLEQAVGSGWSLFARWGYWDLSNTFAPSDEYTAHVFSAGAKLSF